MNEAERFWASKNRVQPESSDPSHMARCRETDVIGTVRRDDLSTQCNGQRHFGALLGVGLLSGLFSIVAAILRQLTIGLPAVLAAVLVAPLVEEILKVAIPIMVLEHRSRWISRGGDLLWLAVGSALVFGVVENLLYTFVYLDNPSSALMWWRWIACTTMHMVASGLSGVGLMRAFNRAQRTDEKARFVWEWPWLVGAIAVHMAFNTFAVFSAEPF